MRQGERIEGPACVKVVVDALGRATYFSRAAIPNARDWEDALLTAEPAIFHQHIGLYAYRRDFLLRLAELPPSPAEQVEKLEQLRVLNAGYSIQVGVIDEPTAGIDTPDDYRAFVRRVDDRRNPVLPPTRVVAEAGAAKVSETNAGPQRQASGDRLPTAAV